MIGKTLGPYKIIEQLGKGGMGEVWLAEDSRLDRRVAVKVLPAELAGDVDRRQRFEQEAKAAAALNHPNIAAIHDVGVETGEGPPTHYMVQEYLQGETLRETISRGPLPFDKTLSLAIEIGEALKTAHRAGIVHRDLKPDNVFVTQDGHAKVLDFGLAKLTELAASPASGPSMSPTMTMAGQMLGTAGYMAPEQVRGDEVDERVDLFALGCVLYEMITGRQAFGGENVHESLSRILGGDPEPIAQESGSNVQFGWLLDKLLAKDREQRYQSAGDAIVDLRRLTGTAESGAPSSVVSVEEPARPAPPKPRSPALLIVVAVAALLLGAGATWFYKGAPEPIASPDLRFEIVLAPRQGFSANYNRVATVSPDGRTVAYFAQALYLRDLGETRPRMIPGTEDSRSPAFSANSREIAFWDSGHIKRVTVDGDAPVVVGPLPERPMGMQWADDGFIYIGRADRGIWKIPASGGEPEPALELEAGEYAHGPELLPGGEWMLFTLGHAVRAWADGSIVAQSLKNNERRVLVPRGREARYIRSGHLSYVYDSTLFAVPFDLSRMEVTGGAVALETNLHVSASDETGAAGYDVSDDGILVFAPPAGTGVREMGLAFVDRDGTTEFLPTVARRFGVVQLSPDGSRIAAEINDLEGTHVWILSADRASAQRLTTTGRNTSPIWSSDGRYVYFASDRDGDIDVWRRSADLSAPAEQVLDADGAQLPTSTTADGQWLYYSRMAPGNSDIARVSLTREPAEEVLIDSLADELNPRISPDGRYLCFQSDETGRWDIHVMEIASGRRWIVSSNSGFFPHWAADGKTILFSSSNSQVNAVAVQTDPTFSADEAVRTFEMDAERHAQSLDVDHDASRILVGMSVEGDNEVENRPRITVVMNWFDILAERVRAEKGNR